MVCMICEWSFSSARIFLLTSGSALEGAWAITIAADSMNGARRISLDIGEVSCGCTDSGDNNNGRRRERQRRIGAISLWQNTAFIFVMVSEAQTIPQSGKRGPVEPSREF